MTTLQLRIDPKLKKEAQKTASQLGMDLSGAIKIFLVQMVATQSLPFNVDCPIGHPHTFSLSAERKLRQAIADVRGSKKVYKNADELFKDILSE